MKQARPIAGLEETRRRHVEDPLRREGDDGGPSRPNVRRPDTRRLLERMRRVDPDQARRYRQRSGE